MSSMLSFFYCGSESLNLAGHSEVTVLAKEETLTSGNSMKKKDQKSIIIKKDDIYFLAYKKHNKMFI